MHDKEAMAWIGVDIGGTKTAVVISANPPRMLARVEFPTQPEEGPEHAIEKIKQSILQVSEESGVKRGNLGGIGVSCGGPLDQAKGVIQAPPNLATWIDVPITTILRDEFGLTCKLENDADAGAVAEHRYGAGHGSSNMVFLTMGTGLGAGLILGGNLYRGSSGCAGEIGHVRLSPSGPVGYGKEGSVEGWASGGGMAMVAEAEVAKADLRGNGGELSRRYRDEGVLTAKDVAEVALNGDELARQIVESTGIRLGEALAILIDLLNPECVVVGGLAVRLGESILGPARDKVRREALPPSANICRIVAAALGEGIGDVAAICVAMGL